MHEREYFTNAENQKLTLDVYQGAYQDYQNLAGINIYYLPLDDYGTDVDGIWGEIQQRDYSSMYGMRMVPEDYTTLGGNEVFSKFGMDFAHEIVLYTSRKEFIERITDNEQDPLIGLDTDESITEDPDFDQYKPKISDLMYIPMWDSFFQVTYVDSHDNMILGQKAFWKLTCKKYSLRTDDIFDITQTGEDGTEVTNEADSKTEVIDAITNIDTIKDDKYPGELDDVTQTGYEPTVTDDVVNDNAEHAAINEEIRYDGDDGGGDALGDW